MVVQQGQLSATDASTTMASFYSDAVVDTVTDVDRIIHNGTQFVRLVLQRPQAVTGDAAALASPDVLSITILVPWTGPRSANWRAGAVAGERVIHL